MPVEGKFDDGIKFFVTNTGRLKLYTLNYEY